MNQVELSKEYSISYFLKGLKPDIEVHVRMLAPRTPMKAYSLAKLAEHSLILQREQNQSIVRNSRLLLPNPNFGWNSHSRGYSQGQIPESSTELTRRPQSSLQEDLQLQK